MEDVIVCKYCKREQERQDMLDVRQRLDESYRKRLLKNMSSFKEIIDKSTPNVLLAKMLGCSPEDCGWTWNYNKVVAKRLEKASFEEAKQLAYDQWCVL